MVKKYVKYVVFVALSCLLLPLLANAANYSMTASVTSGTGTASPASLSRTGGLQSTAPFFDFAPGTGFHVQSIAVRDSLGNPYSAANYTLKNKVSGATITLPAATGVTVRVAINNLTGNITMGGVFTNTFPVANAGTGQYVFPSTLVTLDGTASVSATSYSWSQYGGPATVTLNTANPAKPTFTPVVLGSYLFRLTIDGGSTATTTVTVTNDAASVAWNQCASCHALYGVGPEVYNQWVSSPHSAALVLCAKCHVGADTGGHSGPALSSLANVCKNCHTNLQNHPFHIGPNDTCVSCHNPHSTVGTPTTAPTAAHYNNITTAGYPASYVTSRSECIDCHFDSAQNQTVRSQWAQSGHGVTTEPAWSHYDFKTMNVCVRCHTTTGFIAYSTAKVTTAWGVASDKTKEVLTCKGCHSDITTGLVRTVVPNRPFADEQTYTNRDVKTSNICMDCHTGLNNGQSIQVKVGSADFTNLAYVAPHYLTAGATLHSKSAFLFPDRTYALYSSNTHRKIGMTNNNATGTDGPCVTCHMTAQDKHLFTPVTLDNAGTITAVTTTVCTNCHQAYLSPTVLDANRVAFNNSLAVLNAALAYRGYVYSPNYPYFSAKNWGTDQAGANVMGAAFNYKLFLAEPGAYSHNSAYVKQLIVDSIDAVWSGGALTGDITAAIETLSREGKITQAQADSINGYINPTTCLACHPNLSSSHAAHVGNLPSLVTAYNAADPYFNNNNSDSSGYRFGCAYCHPTVNASHTNGTIVLNGNGFAGTSGSSITCAASTCHADGKGNYTTSPNWYTGFTGADRCAMCHAATPTTGSHPAHTTNGIHAGSGDITYATPVLSCAKCHASTVDSNKNITYQNHVNGTVNVAFMAAKEVSKAQISPASFNAYSTVWTRTGSSYKVDANSQDVSKQFLSAGDYSGGTCATIACHNNGTTPAWGSGPLSCVVCHSAL